MGDTKTKNLGERGEDFLGWGQALLTEAESHANAIKSGDHKEPLALLDLYNRMEMALGDVQGRAELLQSVHPDGGVREAGEILEQEASKLGTELSLDRELFEAFNALDPEHRTLDRQARRLLTKILRDYRRSGVDRDEATREKIRALRKDITEVGQTFARTIREDTRVVELKSAERLAGLPEDFIAAHKPDETGTISICTDWADYFPVISYADDDGLRRELWEKKINLGYPKNEATLAKLLKLRHELATTLGYANWAEYATEELMIKSPTRAREFIEKVSGLGRPRGKRDVAAILERIQKDDPKADAVYPWQAFYWMRRVKEERYHYSPRETRPYFEVRKVLDGILGISRDLFNIEFLPNIEAERWHEDVKAYDVKADGAVVGRIYLDLHPRENKYKHAAMFPLRSGVAGERIAEGAIVCNFPDPAKGGGEAFLEHNDVTTFFHEFGHLLHHILSGAQRWMRFSGVATEWDFVEVPSQLFEEWARDAEMLQRFATDKDGQPIPAELVARMRAAGEFGKGANVMQQMAYASLALGLYNRDPQTMDIDAFVAEQLETYSVYKSMPNTHFHCGFGHLVEYASNYYTYMWSLVIAKDLYSSFKQAGLDDTTLSEKYRRTILGAGGHKDADELVRDFLGRDFSVEAFEAWLRDGE